MSEYDNLKKSGQLDTDYGSLKAATELIDTTKALSSITTEQYNSLVEKFEKAMQMIEVQRSKINELESNKIPTKAEVESISAMFDLLGKIDDTSIAKINRLNGKSQS